MAPYRHDITISPDTLLGERGYWTASVAKSGEDASCDGSGHSIEEALCDLIDNLADTADGQHAPTLANILAAIDKFEYDLGFTAPELTSMRVDQLRGDIRGLYEDTSEEES